MSTSSRKSPRVRKTTRRPTTRHRRTDRPPMERDTSLPVPVLVATDGSAAALAAIRVAELMAEQGRWSPSVAIVLEPRPVTPVELALGAPVLDLSQAYSDSLLGRIRSQLRRRGAGQWPVTVEMGAAAPTIVRLAREKEGGVGCIVLGLGRHGRLARLVGAETVQRVVRHSDVPVLAVESRTRRLPRTAIVGMDFGASSLRAAREALALLQPPGRLHLVHVRFALNGKPLADDSTERTYALGVERKFETLVTELTARPGIAISWELRLGGVLEELLQVADELDADLIAAGSHSHTVVDRLLIGSTPSHLLRASDCSVLVVPPLDDRQA